MRLPVSPPTGHAGACGTYDEPGAPSAVTCSDCPAGVVETASMTPPSHVPPSGSSAGTGEKDGMSAPKPVVVVPTCHLSVAVPGTPLVTATPARLIIPPGAEYASTSVPSPARLNAFGVKGRFTVASVVPSR